MTDLSDIENVLLSTITQAVYPSGTSNPSIVTTPCKLFRGWPIPANLDADLAAGKINVSIYPLPNEQKVTRYPREWLTQDFPASPTLTLVASGPTITVGGTPSSPLNAAAIVNGTGCVYAVQSNDTLTSIATGLAALINENTPATSSGPVITIPAASQITTAVGGVGTIIRETKRQKRSFQITFWCPTPALRDAIAPPVDRVLADIDFLSLPDGTGGRILYERSSVTDGMEKEGLYRRDLIYSVEYGTTDVQNASQIVVQLFNLTGGLDPNTPTVKSFSI